MFVVAGSGSESMLTSSVHDSPYADGIILGAQGGWIIVSSSFHRIKLKKQVSLLDAAIAWGRAPSSAFSLTCKVVILTCTDL